MLFMFIINGILSVIRGGNFCLLSFGVFDFMKVLCFYKWEQFVWAELGVPMELFLLHRTNL